MRAQKKAYAELFSNYLINLLCFRLHLARFRPLITNFYVTKRCNLRCRYCYPPGEEPELPTSAALALLEKIRPHNPAINFTGGEPLLYKDLPLLIQKAKALRFYPIILSTNGFLIDNIIAHLHLVDHLILSLDSLSEEVNDELCGLKGVTEVIKKNITLCALLAPQKQYHLSLHAVLAPETIPGIEHLVDFCEALDITLSVSPEHGRFYPHPALKKNRDYTHLINRMIAMKKAGRSVACSSGYLKTIRDFSPHRCYPFLSPRVEPDGRIYFPCQRIQKRHVYLQDYDSLCQLMREKADPRFFEECSERCFLACYVDVEQYIKNPLAILVEQRIRDWALGRRGLERRRQNLSA
jgi:MoaA/NifB/PqqE/SkfB family radical SAM enzyme